MAALGLSDGDDIVVYDGSGVNLSAARVWWTFRVFGHARVAVLDGGVGKWRSEGRPVESGVPAPAPGRFSARLDSAAVRDHAAVLAAWAAPASRSWTCAPPAASPASSPSREPDCVAATFPAAGTCRSTELVAADGTLLPADDLRRRLAEAGVDPTRTIVATCGSGTSACALILALHVLGHDSAALYDGSWTEWGGRPDTPVATGPA